jgi:hypothetical protein
MAVTVCGDQDVFTMQVYTCIVRPNVTSRVMSTRVSYFKVGLRGCVNVRGSHVELPMSTADAAVSACGQGVRLALNVIGT